MTERTRMSPPVAIRAVTTPVETVTVAPRRVTVTFLSGAAGVPALRVSRPVPELTAWAVHLREPSGQ